MFQKEIQERIHRKHQVRLDDPDSYIRFHHIMMMRYGYIPINEFRDMPIPATWNLLELIREDIEQENKNVPKGKGLR